MSVARRLALATRGYRGSFGDTINVEVPVEVEVEVLKNRYYLKEFTFDEDIDKLKTNISVDLLSVAIQEIPVSVSVEEVSVDVELEIEGAC